MTYPGFDGWSRMIRQSFQVFFLGLILSTDLNAIQPDTVRYQWPLPPFHQSREIDGTFCEFRNTGSYDHFHNAIDIVQADGSPVYAVLDGIVHLIDDGSGSNSYVQVRSAIGTQWKHMVYLHIVPNPSLQAGQTVVKGVTIVGTIYPGMGHLHFGERSLVDNPSSYGTYINNLRAEGGLYPFYDSTAPEIHASTLRFRMAGSDWPLSADNLAGRVEIRIKIEEKNGPYGTNGNNGTYLAGYRIWDSDRTRIVFEPFPDGIAYRFDYEPVDEDVHRVFVKGEATLSNPVYWLTNGDGADYINQNLRVNPNSWDTEQLPIGNYQLEVFSEDTRHNKSRQFFPITVTRNNVVPPQAPTLLGVLNTDRQKSVRVMWRKNPESDILGYRLYYALNTQMLSWAQAADESILTCDMDAFIFHSPAEFVKPTLQNTYFFYLTAVDSSGNESVRSDIYARSSLTDGTGLPQILIVDGFDRYGGSGSWQQATHSFAASYFSAVTTARDAVISCVSHSAVADSLVGLESFDYVIWFAGDQSTAEKTFTPEEQSRIIEYLEQGGRLVVSGSEIGWDLDRTHSRSTPSDTLFYRHYLKARLVDDGNLNMTQVAGIDGTPFQSLAMTIGQIYPEDFPDDVDPVNGSQAILHYNYSRGASGQPRQAGVAYRGRFGSGERQGGVVYLAFPLETVSN
ncbi:MAG: M23 family metallopeptidase, partial [Candidatus Delongbacteria bacterium]|nr:M23 family metallopeptidase [Candidatus Delongbacteria bacterium]